MSSVWPMKGTQVSSNQLTALLPAHPANSLCSDKSWWLYGFCNLSTCWWQISRCRSYCHWLHLRKLRVNQIKLVISGVLHFQFSLQIFFLSIKESQAHVGGKSQVRLLWPSCPKKLYLERNQQPAADRNWAASKLIYFQLFHHTVW